METRYTKETGIVIAKYGNEGWSHFDTNDNRMNHVGPVYKTKAEALSDHEAYLIRAGWLSEDA